MSEQCTLFNKSLCHPTSQLIFSTFFQYGEVKVGKCLQIVTLLVHLLLSLDFKFCIIARDTENVTKYVFPHLIRLPSFLATNL